MALFKKILIANRGEIAIRITRACRELGIGSVAVFSDADRDSLHVFLADEAYHIGPSPSKESYLNYKKIIEVAKQAGVDAIHPGYGFLSENTVFAKALEEAGITFIGPTVSNIESMGDKLSAKALMKKAGVPTVPGSDGGVETVEQAQAIAEKIGLPVIIKASAGGGGKGMRVVRKMDELESAFRACRSEGQNYFADPTVYIEKFINDPKHIEIQVFGDKHGNHVHLFERECSVQRRHQKIIEEATSPSLSDDLRRRMGEAACAIATLGKYKGAGTVEFLLQDNEFYLLEVNTRLQVEHPVTEEVLGVDLVKMQILTAQGEFVHDPKQVRAPRGHSIECRIYAENPFMGGVPSTGLLGHVEWPEGPGRRYEYGFDAGDTITPYYDPMIAKVIVWDETRSRAIQKMIRVLQDSVVFGVHTNIPYLIEILSHKEFVMGTMTTRFIETYFAEALKEPELTNLDKKIAEGALLQLRGGMQNQGAGNSPWASYWRGI